MSDWTETTLGAVVDITIGKTPPRNDPRYWTTDLERPFCTIADMTGASVDPKREGVTEAAEIEGKAKRFPAGSLLMSFKLSIGRVGFAARDLFSNEAIAWLRPRDESVDTRYLAYWLEAQDLTQGAGRAVKGNTLNSASMRTIRVMHPSLAEQRRIVDLMAVVDAQAEALKSEAASIEGVLARLRARYPEGPEVRLTDILLGIDSGRSVVADGDVPLRGEARILKVSAVRSGFFNPVEAKYIADPAALPATALVREGDLLMTRSNTPHRVGFCAVAREVPEGTYMPDLVWRLRVDEARCSPLFLEHLLASEEMRARVTATASGTSASMRKINKRGIGTVRVPLPSPADQAEYVTDCTTVTHVLSSLGSELGRLRTVRARLLASLLGQIISIPDAYDRLLEDAA